MLNPAGSAIHRQVLWDVSLMSQDGYFGTWPGGFAGVSDAAGRAKRSHAYIIADNSDKGIHTILNLASIGWAKWLGWIVGMAFGS